MELRETAAADVGGLAIKDKEICRLVFRVRALV